MARKRKEEKSLLEVLIEFLLIFGGIYLVYKLLLSDDEDRIATEREHGIHGIPGKRKFIVFEGKNNDLVFYRELITFDKAYREKIIKVLAHAKDVEELKGKFVKFFKNDEISGELIKDDIRILFYRKDKNTYYALCAFIKKSNETEERFKQIARSRIKFLR